ncbi:brain and acute leukemia cytoplasmic protein isoform X5 [Heterocephalus glaber]|uniref:Brain and acute leukemia cytoplasmic protein isoform X5 n=1 Tax=Heterocephalus glaber TaxID=10181 RepID=A0AAX6TD64_HETGA|nr:brain and acute leukemia cytoplasmic protein isoform X5 [Heterocephalus glaber]
MGSAPSRVGRAPSSGRDDGETAVLRGQSEVARGWPGHCAPHGALEDGPSPSGVPRATVTSGISNLEKKMNCGIQSLSSGPLAQKQNGLWGTQTGRGGVRLSLKAPHDPSTVKLRLRQKETQSGCLQKKSPLACQTAFERWTEATESQRTAPTSGGL